MESSLPIIDCKDPLDILNSENFPSLVLRPPVQLPNAASFLSSHTPPTASIDNESFEVRGGHLLIMKTGFLCQLTLWTSPVPLEQDKEPSLTLSFPWSTSWDHLLNKILTSKCLPLGMIFEEPKPRLWKGHYELHAVLCFTETQTVWFWAQKII